ncbi:hypothetical protein ARMSODRAFT_1079439 [Armillaria solidipes]|uniref:Uncharacterized protein n=1 Tax=Armillaria solidipes TaxID=1076256 RepID=A0A2H3C2X2_9AGAR|nr:hypothetical protein ARMSODRAFT_1079439 [Armillaria solidipes]
MLRSMNSPPDPHDDHLRHLLDQRATRADLHSRVPSLSEFSDTPSIYSHPFFSPQPADREVDTSSLASQSLSRSSPRPGRERNRLNELAVSMLDLDEDPRSSFASSSVYNDEEQNDYDENDEDDEPMPRMSLLGPKMRFHSKAPWELDEGIVMEDEAESVRSRDHPKNSFSPVQSLQTKKTSFESRRSQGKGSFESVSSQTSYSRGPLHALTHSSASSASLASPQSGPRTPFSISRVRSHSPSLAQSPLLLPTSSRSPPESYISSIHDVGPLDTNASVRSNSSRPSYSSTEEDPHPYSNPNHARSSSEQSYDTSDILPHLAFPAVPRNDSYATVTEAQYGKVFSRPETPQSETPVLPAPHSPRSIIHRKEISSPISVHSTTIRPADISLPSDPSNLPGWTDRGAPPAFGLISLEEARAQRSRTATVQAAASTPSSTDPAFHFPTNESVNGHSPSNGVASRARARSISAGARAKQAFSNIVSGTPVKVERRDSEPAVVLHSTNSAGSSPGGRGLKHKKSGFMRLFNGGKDDKSPPPPVPSLSDGYAAFNAQQSTQKSVKAPIHRIPVPALSPSLTGDDFTNYPFSTKRTHPPLSIKTSSPAAIGRPTPSSAAGPSFPARLGVPNQSIPQSAPANVTEFPALKLRPISTMFSAQFGDHLIPNNSLISPDVDTPSSASPSTAVSPTTPVSFSRLSDKPVVVNEGDDQSTVIRALQDQIVSAKKAWQRHIWELEGQIRDLKEEVELLRASDSEGYCSSCGRGSRQHANESDPTDGESKSISVVNRPRARTGAGTSRFGSAV